MVFQEYGYGIQAPSWEVREKQAPGYCRVYAIQSGKVTYRDWERTVVLQPGWLYVFPSTRPYTMEHDPAQPNECLWCHVNMFPVLVSSLIALPINEDPVLRHTLTAFYYEVVSGKAHYAVLSALAEAWMTLLNKEGCFARMEADTARFLMYIEEQYAQPLRVEDLSRQFGYATPYFIRLFQKRVGVTPYQYLSGCRLSHAALLLRQGETIGRTAELVGYGNAKTFSRAFRNRFGMPPQEYRVRQPTA